MLIVHFFARGIEKAKPDQKVALYCQLEIVGHARDVPFSTRLKVPARYWNGHNVRSSYTLSANINEDLLLIEKNFLDAWKILPLQFPEKSAFTYSDLRKVVDEGTNAKFQDPAPSLLNVLDQLIESKEMKPPTRRGYNTRKKNLTHFLILKGNPDLAIDQVDSTFLSDFWSWLRRGNWNSINVANKHVTMIRSILEFGVDKKYIPYFPLGRANLSYTDPGEPKYLDRINRLKIQNVRVKSLEKVRDTAIFLMYTGFSYTDYVSLQSRHLVESDGRFLFKKARNKTNIFSFPPLLPEAAAIIEKYGSIEQLPRIQIDDYNKLLKVLGELAGLTVDTVGFDLSTSVFRETFSSMCENELMFSDRAIMFFMGHTNPKQLNTYSKVQPARIFREMEAAEKYRIAG